LTRKFKEIDDGMNKLIGELKTRNLYFMNPNIPECLFVENIPINVELNSFCFQIF